MIRTVSEALAHKRTALGKKEKGFTLIELLVVVIIIGILAAVAIPIFLNQQDGARDSAVAAHITQAKTALAVEIAEGATVGDAITAAGADGANLDAFSVSTDIPIVITGTGSPVDGFSITGSFGTAGTNDHIITHDTSAVPNP